MSSTIITPEEGRSIAQEITRKALPRRNRMAMDAGRRSDRVWFRQHPDRDMRIRPALPFEADWWTEADVHIGFDMLVKQAHRPDGRVTPLCFAVPRSSREVVPDDERFLRLFWDALVNAEPGADGKTWLSPETHKALLEASGHHMEDSAYGHR